MVFNGKTRQKIRFRPNFAHIGKNACSFIKNISRPDSDNNRRVVCKYVRFRAQNGQNKKIYMPMPRNFFSFFESSHDSLKTRKISRHETRIQAVKTEQDHKCRKKCPGTSAQMGIKNSSNPTEFGVAGLGTTRRVQQH